jgi:elongation factor Tu
MIKETPVHNQQHSIIGVLGHINHSKTPLTEVLISPKLYDSRKFESGKNHSISEDNIPGTTESLEPQTMIHGYSFSYITEHGDYIKNMIAGAAEIDGAILIFSGNHDDGMQKIRKDILLARQVGIRHVVAFLDTSDGPDDGEPLELVEMEIRRLLSEYDFPGDDTPIIIGSALMALNGQDDNEMGTTAIRKLLDTLENNIPAPLLHPYEPFLMPIEEIFEITNRSAKVYGRVTRGTVRVGEELDVAGPEKDNKPVVTSIENSNAGSDEGQAGDSITLQLLDFDSTQIKRGMFLAQPYSTALHANFVASVNLLDVNTGDPECRRLSKFEAKLGFPISHDLDGRFYGNESEYLKPGNNIMRVHLLEPTLMTEGMRFAINDNDKTIGVGTVLEISK